MQRYLFLLLFQLLYLFVILILWKALIYFSMHCIWLHAPMIYIYHIEGISLAFIVVNRIASNFKMIISYDAFNFSYCSSWYKNSSCFTTCSYILRLSHQDYFISITTHLITPIKAPDTVLFFLLNLLYSKFFKCSYYCINWAIACIYFMNYFSWIFIT